MEQKKLMEKYLHGLIEGDRGYCYALIKSAVDDGVMIQDIYNEVFVPSMIKIGELWQNNEFTVSQEHLATAITQSIISSLYYDIFSNKSDESKGKIILACIGNELHELGPRMLADLLEMDGWDVTYLGANTPGYGIIDMAKKNPPDIIAISCTMFFNIQLVKELIEKIKADNSIDIPIVVGGRVFTMNNKLVEYVGANYFGKDFNDAINIMNNILSEDSFKAKVNY